MYSHFLVPVDGTDACIEAIGQAVEFARSIGARITFLPTLRRHAVAPQSEGAWEEAGAHPISFSCEIKERTWELLSRAEAAARAQGVPCSSVAADGQAPFRAIAAAAREHGCDLICIAPHLQPDGAGESGVPATDIFCCGDVPVLICAIDRRPAISRAIGVLLGEHRAIADELHAWLSVVRTAHTHGNWPAQVPMREAVNRLRVLQTRLHRSKEEGLFPRLREHTPAADAELDELERQHQREEQLLVELAEMVERNVEPGMPTELLEQAVSAYAQFAWEHMGREEGVVLPAARRHLRDVDWIEIAEAFSAMVRNPAQPRP